jgi:two-component system sensor histidine kinase BarA
MSYRTFKKLLGETSLERKCRFLFGGGLLLLITGSFYFYGRLTARLVYDQTNTTGRLLMVPVIYEKHWKFFEFDRELIPVIEELTEDIRMQQPELSQYKWDIFSTTTTDPTKRPSDPAEFQALHELSRGAREVVRMNRETGEYLYFGPVRAAKSCLECHYHKPKSAGPVVEVDAAPNVPDGAASAPAASASGPSAMASATATADGKTEDPLIGMVKITFPLSSTERALAWNNAILMATAIVTAFLAMVAAYVIVRYVIVKPVLHLKDVSDAVSRGHLDQRADIRTGDEFEELSQAFNRMLRHLVHAGDELRDVNTQLDKKVDELAQANLRLFELNNLKNDFLATITHELRTPLNSILGFSDVLTGADNLSEKQQRYLRNIQTSGKDLLSLVNDILDLAKIEAGKVDVHLQDFSVEDLLERLTGMVRPLAEKRNIDLSSRVDERLPLVTQDMGKMQQVLYNLLSNAIKFTPEGGRVSVAAELDDDPKFMRLVVEDTGVGIPLEEQETIFEKFRQGNITSRGRGGSLTREYAGTGLGLSIVMELCKLLGGTVGVSSEVGKGSVFSVRLPIVLRDVPVVTGESLPKYDLSSLRRGTMAAG